MPGEIRKPLLALFAVLLCSLAAGSAAARTDAAGVLGQISTVRGSGLRSVGVPWASRNARRPAARRAARSALETQVLSEINTARAQHGLGRLHFSKRLSAAAETHSRAMARRGFFAHESSDGSAFWKRVRRYYSDRGYRFWSVGENLLWASPAVSASDALKMWMDSAPHRANLLSRRWREIGLSAIHVGSAPGVYAGREVTIVTADFGVRR